MYETTHYPLRYIILHYTATPTIDDTMDAFYKRGVSSHYTIDRNGTIYKHVAKHNTAFHAGLSSWQDTFLINGYSLGIEQINTGNSIDFRSNYSFPCQEADNSWWEIWPTEQIQKTAELVNTLTTENKIKPWHILGHSDIAPGRKVDPGPLFPWKELYTNYTMGFWPNIEPTITKELAATLEQDDYISLLYAIGYPIPGFSANIENKQDLPQDKLNKAQDMDNKLTKRLVISAFQYHYLQDKFASDLTYRSEELDEDTELMILNCINSIVKITGKEDYPIKQLQKLITQNTLSSQAEEWVTNLLNLKTT